MKLMVMISIHKFTICLKNIEFMVMICQLYFNIFHWNLLFHHFSWLFPWNVVWDTCLTFLLFTCGYQPILSQCSFLCPLTKSEKRIPDYFREYRNRSLGYFYPFPFYLRLLITLLIAIQSMKIISSNFVYVDSNSKLYSWQKLI